MYGTAKFEKYETDCTRSPDSVSGTYVVMDYGAPTRCPRSRSSGISVGGKPGSAFDNASVASIEDGASRPIIPCGSVGHLSGVSANARLGLWALACLNENKNYYTYTCQSMALL